MNLQIALKARTLNPDIQDVIRIFDEDFALALRQQFGFTALSATDMAAPVFAAAAAGADVTNPISIEGQQLSLARMTIPSASSLADKTVGYVEDNYHLNIILLRHDHHSEMHPTDTRPLHAGDTLAVLGGPEQLSRLMQDNQQWSLQVINPLLVSSGRAARANPRSLPGWKNMGLPAVTSRRNIPMCRPCGSSSPGPIS